MELYQKDQKIGGGNYNKNGKKKGKWIELDEGFYSRKQVAYKGEYNKNGMKVGTLDIMYKNDFKKGYQQMFILDNIYLVEVDHTNNKEIRKRLESGQNWMKILIIQIQVTYNGEYNMNEIKVGRWDIMYCNIKEQEYKQIGGGQYDQDNNQKKIGKWVELDKSFNNNHQVTHNGEYNLEGQKVGIWIEMFGNRKIRERRYNS